MRAIALVELESEIDGAPPMLTMRELAEVPDDGPGILTVVEPAPDVPAITRYYRTVATRFEDTVTFFPMLGIPEIWRLINLIEDTHPSTSISIRSRSSNGSRPRSIARTARSRRAERAPR